MDTSPQQPSPVEQQDQKTTPSYDFMVVPKKGTTTKQKLFVLGSCLFVLGLVIYSVYFMFMSKLQTETPDELTEEQKIEIVRKLNEPSEQNEMTEEQKKLFIKEVDENIKKLEAQKLKEEQEMKKTQS